MIIMWLLVPKGNPRRTKAGVWSCFRLQLSVFLSNPVIQEGLRACKYQSRERKKVMNGGMTLCRSQIKQGLQFLSWLRDDFFNQRKKTLICPFDQRYGEQPLLRALDRISRSSYPLLWVQSPTWLETELFKAKPFV